MLDGRGIYTGADGACLKLKFLWNTCMLILTQRPSTIAFQGAGIKVTSRRANNTAEVFLHRPMVCATWSAWLFWGLAQYWGLALISDDSVSMHSALQETGMSSRRASRVARHPDFEAKLRIRTMVCAR